MGVSWLQRGDAFGASKTMVGCQLIPIVGLYVQHHPHPTSPIEGEEFCGARGGVARA